MVDRIIIWNKSIDLIEKNFFWGIGYWNSENMYRLITASHAHNYYLQLLLTGGIILLIMIFYAVKVADNALNKCINKSASNIIVVAIGLFFIMGIDEDTSSAVMLYPLLMMALCSKKIDSYFQSNNSINNKTSHL